MELWEEDQVLEEELLLLDDEALDPEEPEPAAFPAASLFSFSAFIPSFCVL